jgi:N6-adenosine-specific RNA methylase IME4
MCLDEIRGLRVCGRSIAELATDTAILYMWAPSPKLAEAMTVVESWGFVYRTCLVWVKPTIGPGYWARQRHEMLLVATRGSMPTPLPPTRPDSVIEAPRGRHSQKPAVVYELIERCWPSLAKVELFARMARDGWDRWGLEAPGSGVVP